VRRPRLFRQARRRLLDKDKIVIVTYGPPSKGWSRLEIKK